MLNFVDTCEIRIKAGNGGDGCVAFHREKYVSAGGPSGGDGGKGGNVVFVADTNKTSLLEFKYKTKYKAENGQNGLPENCYGKKADDLIIKVPFGTVIKEKKSGLVMADISDNEKHILALGGNGGWGNTHFATSTRQIPRFAKPGLPGEEFDLILELKLLADVGLVGFPNVGKSSLISMVSAAKPKIANYHFTTLIPTLGVVNYANDFNFVMADIPGLIEGASEGIGLGHEFLRHVERCRLIVHVVDVSGCEGRNPYNDFELINKELEKYSDKLSKLPMIVAANKSDIATEEQIHDFTNKIKKLGYPVFVISAATNKGIKELLDEIARNIKNLPAVTKFETEFVKSVEESNNHTFSIRHENKVWYIDDAPWLYRILYSANMDDYESLQYFQRVLRKSKIMDSLKEKGIKEGDTVDVDGYEFEYLP